MLLCQTFLYKYTEFKPHTQALFYFFLLGGNCLVSSCLKHRTNISNFEHIAKHFFYLVETFLFPLSFRVIVSKNSTNIVNFENRSKQLFFLFPIHPIPPRGVREDTEFTPNFQALYFDHPKNSACLCGGNCVYLYCN